jgi:hypothetical protein
MVVLNFAHPLTPNHVTQIEALTGQAVDRVVEVGAQFDVERPFAEQTEGLLAASGFTSLDWQTVPTLINLPSLNYIAALLLAELHGRMGYFPAVLRLKPAQGSSPPRFEAAEILNLQAVRDRARERR